MATFNDMPAELRNVLYQELIPTSKSYLLRLPTRNELALFTVSKQIHDESSSYFYQHNHIVINDPSVTTTKNATILPTIADRYLRFLRRLTIHTLTEQGNTPGVRKTAKTIASLAAIGARFEDLNIWIVSPLSHVLNCRVDDSIMTMDHPITVALRQLLDSGVAKTLRIKLKNSWFAPGVTHTLHTPPGSRLELLVTNTPTTDLGFLERPLTGRYSSTHLTAFGLGDVDVFSCSTDTASECSTPSFLPSSCSSALSNLETFSVTSFEMSSEDEVEKDERSESSDERDTSEAPFFTDDDIEDWQASAQEFEHDDLTDIQDEDLDVDEEMEDVPEGDIQALFNNLEETTHHFANEDDVTYMTNFAPDLLLSRHQLGHLV